MGVGRLLSMNEVEKPVDKPKGLKTTLTNGVPTYQNGHIDEEIKCVNCGKEWGYHKGVKCLDDITCGPTGTVFALKKSPLKSKPIPKPPTPPEFNGPEVKYGKVDVNPDEPNGVGKDMYGLEIGVGDVIMCTDPSHPGKKIFQVKSLYTEPKIGGLIYSIPNGFHTTPPPLTHSGLWGKNEMDGCAGLSCKLLKGYSRGGDSQVRTYCS